MLKNINNEECIGDEETVNIALLACFDGLTVQHTGPMAERSPKRRASTVKNKTRSKTYEAKVGEQLGRRGANQTMAIVEAKPVARLLSDDTIRARKGAYIAAWMCREPSMRCGKKADDCPLPRRAPISSKHALGQVSRSSTSVFPVLRKASYAAIS